LDRKRIASGVSAVLNAPLITLATFIPLILSSGRERDLSLIAITGFYGCLLPLMIVGVMLKKGLISDFYATDRNERTTPFLLTIASYTLGCISLLVVEAPPAVTALMACYIVNGFILLSITLKWKISIHASGITSPVTALVYNLGNSFLPFFLLAIPVAWARLELKAHNLKQITAGAVLSSILTWIQMSLYIHYVFI